MSNSWCRLWHDMPNDPKWRTIARVSGQRIGDVIAVFNHLMVSASGNAEKRGVTQCNAEDLATALDVSEDVINSILNAMQGRVLTENYLLGWERRQPKREDNSSARVKEHRGRNAVKRNVTLDADKDADAESITSEDKSSSVIPPPKKTKSKISFDYQTAKFSGLEPYLPAWKEACPAINLEVEIAGAATWLIENPENKKTRYASFIGRWLRKAQNNAPRVRKNGSGPMSFAEQTNLKNEQVIEKVRMKYANPS